MIGYIYYSNITDGYSMLLLIPLSVNKITFLEDLKPPIHMEKKVNVYSLYFSDVHEIKALLNNLEPTFNYSLTLEFIPDVKTYELDQTQIFLSKPIAVNINSSPKIISDFMIIKYFTLAKYLDETVIDFDLKIECQ
jgi:hypothetical protein